MSDLFVKEDSQNYTFGIQVKDQALEPSKSRLGWMFGGLSIVRISFAQLAIDVHVWQLVSKCKKTLEMASVKLDTFNTLNPLATCL
eukprot:4066459-Amphidinium_carterae.1